MKTSANCPLCSKLVSTTHPMQTIKKQMENHLRTHGLRGTQVRDTRRLAGV